MRKCCAGHGHVKVLFYSRQQKIEMLRRRSLSSMTDLGSTRYSQVKWSRAQHGEPRPLRKHTTVYWQTSNLPSRKERTKSQRGSVEVWLGQGENVPLPGTLSHHVASYHLHFREMSGTISAANAVGFFCFLWNGVPNCQPSPFHSSSAPHTAVGVLRNSTAVKVSLKSRWTAVWFQRQLAQKVLLEDPSAVLGEMSQRKNISFLLSCWAILPSYLIGSRNVPLKAPFRIKTTVLVICNTFRPCT